jgi:truncated hemoglobin YjbI
MEKRALVEPPSVPDPADPDAWQGKPYGGKLASDLELLEALGGSAGLRRILEDFYRRVYADARLAPFFADVQRSWVTDKQFNFLHAIFTGARNYMGNHPRNAHHWMVISDELFDHREDLLDESMLGQGVAPEMARRVRDLDEIFRRAIVKDKPIARRINGVEMPVEGYESTTLTIGTLCDGCDGPIDTGQVAVYHVRTGKTFCDACGQEKSC